MSVNWFSLDKESLQRLHADRAVKALFAPQTLESGVITYPSPYDIPMAIRSRYTSTGAVDAIDFRYMTEDEPRILVKDEKEPVMFQVGQNSGRVYEIRLELTGELATKQTAEIIQLVSAALTRITARLKPRVRRSENYIMTSALINDLGEKILVSQKPTK